jgi:hypothetical protein
MSLFHHRVERGAPEERQEVRATTAPEACRDAAVPLKDKVIPEY